MENVVTIDTCDLACPQPIIQTKMAFLKLAKEQKLLVIANDPSFVLDCEVFVRQGGHLLLKSWQEDNKLFYLLSRSDVERSNV